MTTRRFRAGEVAFDAAAGLVRFDGAAARGLDELRALLPPPPSARRTAAPRRPFDASLDPNLADLATAGLAVDSGRAAAAWRRWLDGVDPDDLDQEQLQVLGAALDRHGWNVPAIVATVDAFDRRAWLRGHLLAEAARRLAVGLAEAGVRSVVLKGLAVRHLGGLDAHRRSMHDVDLLVPLDRLDDAVGVAVSLGFTPEGPLADPAARALALPDLHALGLRDEHGTGLDLHWHVFAAAPRTDSDEAVLRRAQPVTGEPWHVPAVEDAVLHAIVHGIGWTRRLGVRWAFDVAAIGRRHPIDWAEVERAARRRRLGSVLDRGLALLEEVGLPVDRPRARRRGLLQRLALSGSAGPVTTLAAAVVDVRRRGRLARPPVEAPPAPDCDHHATGPQPASWLERGWGPPYPWGTWSRSLAPTISLGPVAADKPAVVEVELVPLTGPFHRALHVVVLERNRPLARWRLDGTMDAPDVRRVVVPAGRHRVLRLRLVVVLPSSSSRAGLDASPDHRPLGVCVRRLSWTQALPATT